MATISETYRQAAIDGMSLNITEDEMFILLPSEKDINISYRVEMDEATMQPKSCNCPGNRRWAHCKHCSIIADAFAGYVAPATPVAEQETRITEIEPNNWYNKNTQVWRAEEGQWMAVGPTANAIAIVEAHIAKQQAVAEAERIVARPVVTQPATEARKVSSVIAAKVAEAARIIASGEISNETAAKFASATEPVEQATVPVSNAAADANKLNSYLSSQEVDLGFLGTLTSSKGFQLLR